MALSAGNRMSRMEWDEQSKRGGLERVEEHVMVREETKRPPRSRASLFPLSCTCPLTLARPLTLRIEAPRPHNPCLIGPFPRGYQCPPLANHSPWQALHLPQAQLWHWTEGTHRMEEPVSKRTRKFCDGVPMLISPRYILWGAMGQAITSGGIQRPSGPEPPPWTEPLPYNAIQRQRPKPIFHPCREHTDLQSGLAGGEKGAGPRGQVGGYGEDRAAPPGPSLISLWHRGERTPTEGQDSHPGRPGGLKTTPRLPEWYLWAGSFLGSSRTPQ